MKRLGRVLPAAAVVLLGALGFAVVGCSKQPDVQPEMQLAATKTACSDRVDGVPVTVFVKWEKDHATTANKVIYLCNDKDWVEWVSCDGNIEEPVFSGDSPFDPKDKFEKGDKKLKSPKPKKAGGFNYEIELVLADGTRHIVDPRIEVVP